MFISLHPKKEGVLKLQVDKGNYVEFRQYLCEKEWNGNTEDVDILWDDFFNTMQVGVDKFVPKKVIKPSNAIKRSCPWSPGLLHKVHMKRIAFKNYKKYPSTKNYKIYCKYRNQVKWESRKSLRHKEKKIAQQVKKNSKVFYQYVSSKIKGRESV